MKLYWKDTEIPAGARLQVIESGGDGLPKIWKILEIREKKNADEYYDPSSGKSHPLTKVMNNRRLFRKSRAGELVQVPPCTCYLVIEEMAAAGTAETAAGEAAGAGTPVKKCFNVDFLTTLWDVKIL
jgi:hypothetical protein